MAHPYLIGMLLCRFNGAKNRNATGLVLALSLWITLFLLSVFTWETTFPPLPTSSGARFIQFHLSVTDDAVPGGEEALEQEQTAPVSGLRTVPGGVIAETFAFVLSGLPLHQGGQPEYFHIHKLGRKLPAVRDGPSTKRHLLPSIYY